MRFGKFPKARNCPHKRGNFTIRERLAAQDLENTVWQHDLSGSYQKIGEVRARQGDLPRALEAYQASLAIRERLVARDTGNTLWKHDLSVSYGKVGRVWLEQDELPLALEAYQAGLSIAEQLAAKDPGNTSWQRNLTVSQVGIGDARRALAELPRALEAYQVGLSIAERLAAQDPSNAEWQRDLWVSLHKVCLVLEATGSGSEVYRKRLHATLSGMRRAGMPLDPAARDLLAQLDRAAPREAPSVGASRSEADAATSRPP